MKFHQNDPVFQKLKQEVLGHAKLTHLLPGDCRLLAGKIEQQTGKILSETTLKRIFGFAAQTFDFSAFTLNALAEYVGFKGWEEFWKERKENHPVAIIQDPGGSWTALAMQCRKISEGTAATILKNGYINNFEVVVNKSLIQQLSRFLNSSYRITAVVAPTGFGKSCSFAAITEPSVHITPLANHLVLFLKTYHLFIFINSNLSFDDWLCDKLNVTHIGGIFDQQGQDQKLVIILDDFDERAFPLQKLRIILHKIHDMCQQNVNAGWLKVVINTRPSLWLALQDEFQKMPGSEACFWDYTTALNTMQLPVAGDAIKLLQVCGLSEKSIRRLSPWMLRILNYPAIAHQFSLRYKSSQNAVAIQEALLYAVVMEHIMAAVARPQRDQRLAIAGKLVERLYLNKKMPGENITLQEAGGMLDAYLVLEKNQWKDIFNPSVTALAFSDDLIGAFFLCRQMLSGADIDTAIHLLAAADVDHVFKSLLLRWVVKYDAENLSQGRGNTFRSFIQHTAFSDEEKMEMIIFLWQMNISGSVLSDQLKHLVSDDQLERLLFGSRSFLSHFAEEKLAWWKSFLSLDNTKSFRDKLNTCLFYLLILKADNNELKTVFNTDRLPVNLPGTTGRLLKIASDYLIAFSRGQKMDAPDETLIKLLPVFAAESLLAEIEPEILITSLILFRYFSIRKYQTKPGNWHAEKMVTDMGSWDCHPAVALLLYYFNDGEGSIDERLDGIINELDNKGFMKFSVIKTQVLEIQLRKTMIAGDLPGFHRIKTELLEMADMLGWTAYKLYLP